MRDTSYWADVMSPEHMAEHRRKNGMVLLPIGCFEMHGPHAPMPCDTLIAQAACLVLSREWDALTLPPIHYAYSGGPGPWPGTVDVPPTATMAYLKAVILGVLKSGFERVVVVDVHLPNVWIMLETLRSIFYETGQSPLFYFVDFWTLLRRLQEEWGPRSGEDLILLGALHVLGRHGDWNPEMIPHETLVGPGWPDPAIWQLRKRRVIFGYYFTRAEQHVGQYPGMRLDQAPRAAEIFRDVVLEKAKDLPRDYDAFLRDLKRAAVEKPWSALQFPQERTP